MPTIHYTTKAWMWIPDKDEPVQTTTTGYTSMSWAARDSNVKYYVVNSTNTDQVLYICSTDSGVPISYDTRYSSKFTTRIAAVGSKPVASATTSSIFATVRYSGWDNLNRDDLIRVYGISWNYRRNINFTYIIGSDSYSFSKDFGDAYVLSTYTVRNSTSSKVIAKGMMTLAKNATILSLMTISDDVSYWSAMQIGASNLSNFTGTEYKTDHILRLSLSKTYPNLNVDFTANYVLQPYVSSIANMGNYQYLNDNYTIVFGSYDSLVNSSISLKERYNSGVHMYWNETYFSGRLPTGGRANVKLAEIPVGTYTRACSLTYKPCITNKTTSYSFVGPYII